MAGFRSAMLASAVASAALAAEHAYADGGSFRFPPFSNPSPPAPPASDSARPGPPPPHPAETPPKEEPRVRNDNPRTSAAGFDPEALERGAKALREISSSSQAKKMFELLKKQEETRQEELAAKKSEFQALQAQHETDRQRVIYEEQKKLVQQQAQTKAQMARYEDELTRKRMQAEHESQRARNQELVKLQEESSIRQEQIRRTTEEQIQAQRRQTEREKAEIERETIRVKALAEAEGRAHEAKLAEEVNRRMLIEWANAEREKWISAINTTFDHIGGGLRAILSDQNKLIVAVGGVTALTAGVYTTREGAKVVWGYVNRVVSAIHAVVAVSFASFSLQDWSCSLFAFASRSSPLQMKAFAVKLSYLIYDLVCCLFDRNPKMDNSIHHLVSIVGIGAGLAYEMCGSEMVASIWITEISRAFLHMRELLKELGYRDTNLNFTVDVLFAAIFSLARMVGGPYLTYVTLRADNPLLIKAMALGLELVLRVLQDPQDVQI